MKFRVNPFFRVVLCLASATALAVSTLRAQIVNDGATNTLSNVTNSFTGDVTVGTNGSFTLLVLSNNALLTNSANGVIGRNATAKSNEVRLISATARWLMGGDLLVGSNSSFNRLVVSNGARVDNFHGTLAAQSASSNNEALVTGPGSVWTNRGQLAVFASGNRLTVSNGAVVASGTGAMGGSSNRVIATGAGSLWTNQSDLSLFGSGNRLDVTDGGWVADGRAFLWDSNTVTLAGSGSGWNTRGDLQIGNFASGSVLIASNGATVLSSNAFLGAGVGWGNTFTLLTGTGTLWSNRNDFAVGRSGFGNRLVVSNGATVFAGGNGVLGFNSGANSNTALVTDAGSRWLVGASLYVGSNGSFNTLVVSNSATVSSSSLFVGFNAGNSNNRVVVDGGTLRVTNAAGTGVLDVRRGTNVLNAGLIDADQLLLTNVGKFEFNSGTLITRGVNFNFGTLTEFRVGSALGLGPAVWDVRPGVTDTFIAESVVNIGRDSSFNQMLNTNGALITSGYAILGEYPGANSNSLVLAGVGSQWLYGGCSLGGTGACNRIVVSDGAAFSGSRLFISFDPASTNNEVVVSGVGSAWTNSNELRLGFIGSGNRLVISNGGRVENNAAFLGDNLSSSNNELVVTGPGSACSNLGELHVGESGSANRLVISNGGWLVSSNCVLGFNQSSSNNELLVTGAGSVCSNRNELRVGGSGSGNRLEVNSGGTVSASDVFFGFNPTSLNNSVTVDGGTLRAVNATRTGKLDVRGGSNIFNAGLIELDQLLVTNSAGRFVFNGGKLTTRFGTISAGTNFVVGNAGTIPAVWNIRGDRFAHKLPPSAISSGTYLPTDFEPGDVLPAPAPAGPYDTDLSTFDGTAANGPWSLFIMDDELVSIGSLASWSLQIQTTTGAFTNVTSGSILIPSNSTSGPASPYPSVLTVAGLSGFITNLTVTLSGLAHTFPTDLDVLLVGPGGQKVMLMSDAGGGGYLTNVTIVFDDRVIFAETSVLSPLIVGQNVAGCQLLVTNSNAALLAAGGVIVGANAASTGNRVLIGGGTLRATNASGTATFEVRRGTNVCNSGLMELDRLLLTSASGYFEFNGGDVITRTTTVNNGRIFTVGDGVNAAGLRFIGGTHAFADNVEIANNASLVGHGSVIGTLTVKPGGTLVPSNTPSVFGTLSLSQTPVLQGATRMRIYRSESFLTNDQIQTPFSFNYGGSITVTQIPALIAGTLTLGDRFQLFSASAYGGAFSTLTLPPLTAGLEWTNKLLVDGSIEVVKGQPRFSGITLSGTNVILSGTNGTPGANYAVLTTTNVATPTSNWVSLVTNQFGAGGSFSFTNPIAPGERQRYFRIRTP